MQFLKKLLSPKYKHQTPRNLLFSLAFLSTLTGHQGARTVAEGRGEDTHPELVLAEAVTVKVGCDPSLSLQVRRAQRPPPSTTCRP